LKKIERTLHVTMIERDGELKIIGPEETVDEGFVRVPEVCWNCPEEGQPSPSRMWTMRFRFPLARAMRKFWKSTGT
jgi:hypothetical protein